MAHCSSRSVLEIDRRRMECHPQGEGWHVDDVALAHLITHNSWRPELRRKSFTVKDIADGVVNSFGMSFTLAIWAAHAARGNELGSGRIQGH